MGPLIQLGPNGSGPATSWEAYPLPINNPGQPHVLEIEYPSDVPQSLGISLMEPNAAGTVAPIGLDSGVYVSDEEAENVPQLVKHRVTFWPRTKTPLLLVTNRRQGSRAVYGKITVLGARIHSFRRWRWADPTTAMYCRRPLRPASGRRGCGPAIWIVRCSSRTFPLPRRWIRRVIVAWTIGALSTKGGRGWSNT